MLLLLMGRLQCAVKHVVTGGAQSRQELPMMMRGLVELLAHTTLEKHGRLLLCRGEALLGLDHS